MNQSAEVLLPPKVPPHSVQAEQSVLGGLMLDDAVWEKVADRINEKDFYRKEHRLIFRAIRDLVEGDRPCDVVTVSELLAQRGQLKDVGGMSYLTALVEATPSAANITAYADIVRERAILRQLAHVGTEIADSAFHPEGRSTNELLEMAEQKVFQISDQRQHGDGGFKPIKGVLAQAVDRIQELYEKGGSVTGVSTGFVDLDQMTAGLQPSDLIIIAGRPSMGKCVVSGTRIPDPESGRLRAIDEMVRERRGGVLALDPRLRVRPARAAEFVDDGLKPVFRVRTRLGRTVTTTASHPFLTPLGWRPLVELQVGDAIGVPRRLPLEGQWPLPEHQVKLLAYFLGDGGTTASSPHFTNGNLRILEDFRTAVEGFAGMTCQTVCQTGRTPTLRVVQRTDYRAELRKRFAAWLERRLQEMQVSARWLARRLACSPTAVGYWRQGVALPNPAIMNDLVQVLGELDETLQEVAVGAVHYHTPNPLVRFLEEMGLKGRLAPEKRVPEAVFTLPRRQLALFLNRLFACDGSAWIQNGRQPVIGYSTASEGLAKDLVHLLLRFGVVAKLRYRQVRYQGELRPFYELRITHTESLRVFIDEIGILGKEDRLEQIRQLLAQSPGSRSNLEGVPALVWRLVDKEKGERTWREIYGAGEQSPPSNFHRRRPTVGRKRLRELAALLDSEALAIQADNDVLWDPIEAIEPLGLRRVYDLCVPELANFVADDVFVHNTSFAMNIAENVAIKEQKPVAVFSMEMPADHLAMRMMSSLGRIDQHRLRTGQLEDDEWPRMTSAINILAGTKLFIDDTPALSPTELRARCRRLAREHSGLGLIVIDYLQLMQAPGAGDNRTAEISEISRGLKALAKEMNAPVIALSQLNRNLEQRPNKRPVMSDLRESGCLTGDTLIPMADSGVQVPLRELIGRSGFWVWALDESSMRLRPAEVSNAFSTGIKSVYRLRTRSGRTIKATANHPFLTVSGWKRLDELAVGEYVAAPRVVPASGKRDMSDAELALLGHLIGDGCTLPRHAIQYTTRELDLAELVSVLARQVFGDAVVPRICQERQWYQVYLTSKRRLGNGVRNPEGWTTRKFQATLGISYCGGALYKSNLSRTRLARIGEVLGSSELSALAGSDVYWDAIESIEYLSEEEVFDLTVPGFHNFVADNLVVHNSIEQDADVIVFIYRDEVYNEDSPDKGTAEIIVAKQRNGPIGTVRLTFLGQYTRFENFAKDPYDEDDGF